MKMASEQFNDQQQQRVNRVVGEAESRTSAEIAPVVATASGRYDRPEDVAGLWVAVAAVLTTWLVLPDRPETAGSWGGWPLWVHLVCLAASVFGGFVVGATVASRVGWLRRLFTPGKQMREEVETAARTAFFDSRVHHTAGATGLVVYISLYERMASIVADRAILEELGQEAIDEMVGALTGRLAGGEVCEALCETIDEIGERLSTVLPRAADDVNELPDGLVLVD